jgi:glycosyltransferase involved in cell wall biosynthesis
MKIAVYSPTFYPIIDGTSIQARRQVDLMSDTHEVRGISFLVDREMKECKKLGEIDDGVMRIKPKYFDIKRFPSLRGEEVVDELNHFNPDVIHLRGWYQFRVIDNIITNFLGKKIRIFWHADGLHECHDFFYKKIFYKKIVRKAIDSGIIFIGHTNHDFEILSSLGLKQNQYEQLPPLIDRKIVSNEKDWSQPKILSLSRFFNYKRHEDVFDIVKKVDRTLEVLLAGSSDSEDAKGIIERLNQKRASLILNPSDSFVNYLYGLTTHFVLASNRETLGIVALEAAVAGCIPLVKRNKGISSYLPEQLIFDDLCSFEEKLYHVIQPNFSKKIYLELEDLREKLLPEKTLLELEKIYMRVL